MLYTTLVSNIEAVKDSKLEAKTNEISISVLEKDIKAKNPNPVFYATRYGMIYDPTDFAPINVKGGQKLKNDSFQVESYYQMLPEARRKYANYLELFNTGEKKDDESKYSELMEKLNAFTKQLDEKELRIKEQALRIEELKKQGKPEKVVHYKFDKILAIAKRGYNIYLYGDSGTGKSRLVEDLAEKLGTGFYPASTITQEHKFTGYKDINGLYQDTNFYKAFTNGGIFFLDEMDSCLPDVIVALNMALASRYFDFPNGTVKAHKDFICIGAGNTIGRGGDEKFTARAPMDLSTLDRFVAIEIDYDIEIDRVVAKNDEDLVQFAQAVRETARKYDIKLIMSYRAITNIKDLDSDAEITGLFTLTELIDMTLTKGVAYDDIRSLYMNMDIAPNNRYYKALKKVA